MLGAWCLLHVSLAGKIRLICKSILLMDILRTYKQLQMTRSCFPHCGGAEGKLSSVTSSHVRLWSKNVVQGPMDASLAHSLKRFKQLSSSAMSNHSEQVKQQGRFLPLGADAVSTFSYTDYSYFVLDVVSVLYITFVK